MVPDSFVKFMHECEQGYKEICDRIDDDEIPEGHAAKMTIRFPAAMVDQMRLERMVAVEEGSTNGGS